MQAHTHTSRLKARRSSGLAAHPATVCVYALEKMPGRGPSRRNKEPKEPAAAFRFRLHRRPAWGSVPSVPLEGLERDFRQRCWAESGEGSEAGLEAGFGPTCRMVIKEIASWAVPGHVCLQIRIQQNARASSPAPRSQPTLETTNLLQSQNRQEPHPPKDFVAKPANGLGFGAFRVCLYSGRNSSCERTASRSKLHVGGFRQHLHKPTSIRASLWPRWAEVV